MGDPFTPIAVGAGVSLLSRMLNRGQKTVNRVKNEATRLDNVNAPDSSYGYPIRDLFGECKVDGCSLIWAKPLKEVITTTSSTSVTRAGGGKGGAGGSTTTTITETEVASYYMTCAFLIGGQIAAVEKVWANGILIFDANSSDGWYDQFRAYTEIYTGTNNQSRSSVIGGDTPALRGCSYIVFNNYPIELYRGSGFPKLDVQVKGLYWDPGADRLDLATTVTHIFNKAGIPSDKIVWNASAGVVMYGAIFENTGESYATFLEDLCTIHGIDYFESGGKINFVKRSAPTWTHFVPIGDLCARRYGDDIPDPYRKIKADPISVPSDVSIDFISRSKEWSKVNCNYRDPSASHYSSVRIGTRIVTNEYDMVNTAAYLVQQARWEANTIEELSLMPYWGFLQVGDPLAVYEKETCRVYRLTEVLIANDYRVVVKGVCTSTMALVPPPPDPSIIPSFPDLNAAPVPVTEIATSYAPPVVRTPGTATLIPLDIHLINDTDPDNSVYVAVVGSEGWRGGTIVMSRDGGASYDSVGGVSGSTVVGKLGTAPPPMDVSGLSSLQTSQSFVVYGVNGQLSSVTQQKFDDNRGLLFLVGDEFIMARDATLTGEGTYTISYLRRGVRGTEWAMGSHAIDSDVVCLSSPLLRVDMLPNDLGREIRFKAVGTGAIESSITDYYTIPQLAFYCNKPYSPASVEVVKNQDGDMTISWVRRDRRSGYASAFTGLPMSETSEQYEVAILGGGTLTSNQNFVNYTATRQIMDFGVVQEDVNVTVYQMNATVGRGWGRTIDSSPDLVVAPVMTVTSIVPNFGVVGQSQDVVITGTNLDKSEGARINNYFLTNYVIVSPTQVTARVSYLAGTGDIIILANDQLPNPASDINAGTFTFGVPEMTVTSYNPTFHTSGQTTTVNIYGTGLNYAMGVTIGAIALTDFTVVSSTHVTATVPANAVTGNLTVLGDTGLPSTPDDVVAGVFSVNAPVMTVSDFTPTSHTYGQSTSITINGTGLNYAMGVTIGAVALTNFTIVSSSQITATVPSNTETGTLTVLGNTSYSVPPANVNAGTFTVNASVMTVSGLSPNTGYSLTSITITGTNFTTNATGVKIGTINLTNFTVVSDTEITATIPTGASTGTITVVGNTSPPYPVGDVAAGTFTVLGGIYTPTGSGLVAFLDAAQYSGTQGATVVAPFTAPGSTINYTTDSQQNLLHTLTELNNTPSFKFVYANRNGLSFGDILDDVFSGASAQYTIMIAVGPVNSQYPIGDLLSKGDPSSTTEGGIYIRGNSGGIDVSTGTGTTTDRLRQSTPTLILSDTTGNIITVIVDQAEVINTDRQKVRIDGVLQSLTTSQSGSGITQPSTFPLAIGPQTVTSSTWNFRGNIGKVAIWDRVLTTQEITDNENAMSISCGGII
jgi:hypothetical protein